MTLNNITNRTNVCKSSLNPVWTDNTFKFEVDDETLQDETLIVKVDITTLSFLVSSSHTIDVTTAPLTSQLVTYVTTFPLTSLLAI